MVNGTCNSSTRLYLIRCETPLLRHLYQLNLLGTMLLLGWGTIRGFIQHSQPINGIFINLNLPISFGRKSGVLQRRKRSSSLFAKPFDLPCQPIASVMLVIYLPLLHAHGVMHKRRLSSMLWGIVLIPKKFGSAWVLLRLAYSFLLILLLQHHD